MIGLKCSSDRNNILQLVLKKRLVPGAGVVLSPSVEDLAAKPVLCCGIEATTCKGGALRVLGERFSLCKDRLLWVVTLCKDLLE